MQAVRIRIYGEFWDSQLAGGRLVLFGRAGDIRVLDWDRVVEDLPVEERLKSELIWTCCRNDALYKSRAGLGNPGSEVWGLLRDKFDGLSASTLDVSPTSQISHLLSQSDNRFPFPHRDSAMAGRRLYVLSQKGLHGSRSSSGGVGTFGPPVRLADVGGFAVRPKSESLAIAAGDDGLFEFDPNHERRRTRDGLSQLTDQNCIDCGWTYWTIYGSSFKTSGYLISSRRELSRNPKRILPSESAGQFSRKPELKAIYARSRREPLFLREEAIFKERGYSWGTQDSICQVEGDTVRIVRYSPRARTQSRMLHDMGVIQIAGWKGDILSGRVALFGIIIECEEALVLKLSSGEVLTLPGEIVRFRTFPESRRYENQMHVVYEDRLEIFAFTHDYFVSQRDKKLGYRL
jgi:hypothetical protein